MRIYEQKSLADTKDIVGGGSGGAPGMAVKIPLQSGGEDHDDSGYLPAIHRGSKLIRARRHRIRGKRSIYFFYVIFIGIFFVLQFCK